MTESFYPPKFAQKITDNLDTPKYKELPVLGDSGDIYGNEGYSVFDKIMLCFLVLGVLAGMGVFLYYVSEGKFQSNNNNNQDVSLSPQINVSTSNAYSFNPSTDNEYHSNANIQLNQTIIIEKLIINLNSTG